MIGGFTKSEVNEKYICIVLSYIRGRYIGFWKPLVDAVHSRLRGSLRCRMRSRPIIRPWRLAFPFSQSWEYCSQLSLVRWCCWESCGRSHKLFFTRIQRMNERFTIYFCHSDNYRRAWRHSSHNSSFQASLPSLNGLLRPSTVAHLSVLEITDPMGWSANTSQTERDPIYQTLSMALQYRSTSSWHRRKATGKCQWCSFDQKGSPSSEASLTQRRVQLLQSQQRGGESQKRTSCW